MIERDAFADGFMQLCRAFRPPQPEAADIVKTMGVYYQTLAPALVPEAWTWTVARLLAIYDRTTLPLPSEIIDVARRYRYPDGTRGPADPAEVLALLHSYPSASEPEVRAELGRTHHCLEAFACSECRPFYQKHGIRPLTLRGPRPLLPVTPTADGADDGTEGA